MLLSSAMSFLSPTVLTQTLDLLRRLDLTTTRQPAVLADARRAGRPALLGSEQKDLLQTLLALCPQELGLPHAAWNAPLLRETMAVLAGIDVSARTVRRTLAGLDYTWKRPRYVLAADPELEKKTAFAPPGGCFAPA